MNRALTTFALVCAVSAVAWGQDREQIRRFSSFDKKPTGGGTISFEDGTRFGVPKAVYEQYTATFSELTGGERVRYTTDAQGRLATISVESGATEQVDRERVISGTFQKREGPVQGHYWITIDARNYKVSVEVYERREIKGVLHFLRPGQKVRLLLDGSSVLDLARGRLEDVIAPELWETIARSNSGDTVLVNETAYTYVGADLHGVNVTPLGDPTETQIRLQDIRTFENRAALDRDQGDSDVILAGDAFESSGVEVGDTVGIGLDVGQLIELTSTQCVLRVWRNERWADTRTWPRNEVSSIRWVSLSNNHNYAIQGGNVHLRVQRRRAAREEGLTFQFEISHDLPSTLLADAKIVLSLGKSGLDEDTTPLATAEIEVPTLFVGDRLRLEHRVKDEALVDGFAVLKAGESNMRALTSDEARGFIQQALVRAKDDLNALARIYAASASNGDETLVGMLIDRATYPVHGLSDKDLARSALRGIAPQALELVLADLERPEHELQRTVFQEGKLRQVLLVRLDTKPSDHKNKLVELLSALPGGLREKAAQRLFNLHTRADLRDSIEKAFASDPTAAVESLLKVATAPPTTSDSRAESERAGKLLERLADTVLEELVRELRRRGIDVADLTTLQQSPDTESSEVVAAALRLIAEDARKAHLRALELRFEEAKALVRTKDFSGALTLLRSVIKEQAKHTEARALLPEVLIAVGDEKAAEGLRGEAAQLFKEALGAGPKGAAANPRLGKIFLAVAKEELEGTAIRRLPLESAARIRLAKAGEQLTGPAAKEQGWIRVSLTGDPDTGFVNSRHVAPAGGATAWSVKAEEPPRDEIERILSHAKALDPSVAGEATQIEGSLLMRDAMSLYDEENYLGALELFQRGQPLVPDDPRLEYLFWCQVQVYKVFLYAAGAILLLILGFIVMRLFKRPKKVKLEGGFQHYGKNRTKRERDVAIDDPAPEGEDG